jgi:hypothetical protein
MCDWLKICKDYFNYVSLSVIPQSYSICDLADAAIGVAVNMFSIENLERGLAAISI